MENSNDKRIIEINGVKIEVDLRTAKRVDVWRVGDRVKVLTKPYQSWVVSHGVIVAFDEFKSLPSITVCYMKSDYNAELCFAVLNADSKDIEIAPVNDDVLISRDEVVRKIDNNIEQKRNEIRDLEAKRAFFLDRFGAWFKTGPQPEQAEVAVEVEL